MKKKSGFLVSTLLLAHLGLLQAQTYNWKTLEKGNHVLGFNAGLNFGFSYGLHYARVFSIQNHLLLPFAEFSLPTGKSPADDYTVKLGASLPLLKNNNWQAMATVALANRQNKNPFVSMQSLALAPALQFGYYNTRWFFALNAGIDYGMALYLRHSAAYKANYKQVRDGWYAPEVVNTLLGFNTGLCYKKTAFTLRAGLLRTRGFSETPTLPFYGELGLYYKL